MFGLISQPCGHEMWLWTSATKTVLHPMECCLWAEGCAFLEAALPMCCHPGAGWLVPYCHEQKRGRSSPDQRHLLLCHLEGKMQGDGKWIQLLQRDPCSSLSALCAVKPSLCLQGLLRLHLSWGVWFGIRLFQEQPGKKKRNIWYVDWYMIYYQIFILRAFSDLKFEDGSTGYSFTLCCPNNIFLRYHF